MAQLTERKVQIQSFQINVYGFSGKIGSGKDYVAKNIFPRLLRASGDLGQHETPLYLAFADLLKTICAGRFGLDYDDLYVTKTPETRKRLQEVGDELRKKNGELYFVNAMKLELAKHAKRSGIRTFIFTDVRFPEEFIWIHEMGGVVFRVNAPKRSHQKLLEECKGDQKAYEARAAHRSETLLDCAKFDAIIENDPEQNPAQGISDWIQKGSVLL